MPILGTQSSISANAYGFGGTSVSASVSVTPTNLTEGTQITVTVTTDSIDDGTTLYYTVSGTLGTITASDFKDNSLSGSFVVNNDTGSFNKTVAADGVVEDGEAFVIQIRKDSITGQILDTTSSVYIQGSQVTGVTQIVPSVNGVQYWDFLSNGTLILDGGTSSSYTLTAETSVKFKAFVWGQGGDQSTGGYSYGTFDLNQGDVLYMRLNYGAGSPGTNYGWVPNGTAGGLAGIFVSSSITQANARLIAGGGGGSGYGHGSSPGGYGGGSSGNSGTSSSDTQIGSTGGGGGNQSSGGGGGGAGGQSGSALQGGRGGDGVQQGYPNAGGGGGGGGGYFGGGGGGGGNDSGSGTRNASGGGGGSGYVHNSIINGFTGLFSSGENHPNRGSAGASGQNSRIVLEPIVSFNYVSGGSNESYIVNVPQNVTLMTAKVWGSGGAGTGEGCGGPYSGGSGGYVEGKISVTSGDTIQLYIGASGLGSPEGQSGYGAGRGGEFSRVVYGANYLIAGGGGGAGQAGNGGYGGGNGSGGSGTGYLSNGYAGQGGSQSYGGAGGTGINAPAGGSGASLAGGAGGGSGINQGNRGGGGGGGYFGGGGGGGADVGANCYSGGGGGGSGIIYGSWTNTVSYNGQTGTSGGRTATNSGDVYYVSGYGGSSQNGLIVLIFD